MDQPWTDQLWPETSAPPVAPRQEGTPEPKSPPQEPSQEDTGADNSLVGKPAPDFELRMVLREQTKLKLSDLQGKAVLLNFWASWCEPCKFEMPWFEEFQQKYGEQGFQVIGIALEDHGHEEAAAEFADKAGVHYPILVGTDAVAELYGGVDGLPQTFFIDRTGTIVAHEIGLESMSTIEANIKKVLAEKLDVGQCGSK